MNIPEEHLRAVCKIGEGNKCCRYIGFSDGWACLKHSSLKETLDARVWSKTMNARGDNCDGNCATANKENVK